MVTLLARFIGKRLTQLGSYLQYNSHHPIHVKRGVVESLFDRAARVTLQQEDEHLRGALKMKWLPWKFCWEINRSCSE